MKILPFRAPPPALAVIGQLQIPAEAMDHYHVQECDAVVSVMRENKERIVGTANHGTPHCQLYGWGENVPPHADDTGWIYVLPLRARRTVLHVGKMRARLLVGTVYRMHDFVVHWTRDSAPVLCAFAGVFDKPQDRAAMAMLRTGLAQLAAGKPYAPRVSEGFRTPKQTECYAIADDGPKKLVDVAHAKRKGMVIATCAHCSANAVRVDKHFPYHWDNNRCAKHLTGENNAK